MGTMYESAVVNCYTSIFGYFNSKCFLCVAVIMCTFIFTRRRRGMPPGPCRLPVIGNLTSLCSTDTCKVFADLRKKYGNVYSVYLGQETVIVLNGYDAIHNALICNGRAFSYRPETAREDLIKGNGILFSNGTVWKQQRRFAQTALQPICHKEHSIHIRQIVKEEVDCVVNEMNQVTEAFCIKHLIDVYSLNVMFRLVFGQRFDFKDPRALEFINLFHDIAVDLTVLRMIFNCLPFMRKLPDVVKLKRLQSKQEQMLSYARKYCGQTCSRSNGYKTFCDAFKEQMKNQTVQCKNLDNNECFTDDQNEAVCMDLIGAGSDTTANAILWILLYLTREPKVQDNMFKEIYLHFKKEREITFDDRKHLPYTEAAILEGLRISSSTPFALPHSVADDIYIEGFLIPKGCTVLPNLTSVLHDPDIFREPNKFQPERFLSGDGKKVVTPKEFIPFSVGPRSCLGESLARNEMFSLVAAIVQRFKLLPEVPGSMPSTGGKLSTVLKPLPFKVRVIKR